MNSLINLQTQGYAVFDNVSIEYTESLLELLGAVDPSVNGPVGPAVVQQPTLFDDLGTYDSQLKTFEAFAIDPPRYVALLALGVPETQPPTVVVDLYLDEFVRVAQSLHDLVLDTVDLNGVRRPLKASEVKLGKRIYRWDAKRCPPVGDIPRELMYIKSSGVVEWEKGRLLLLDNWRVLHRFLPTSVKANAVLWRGYSY